MHTLKILIRLLKHGKRWLGFSIMILDGLFFGLTDPNTVASPLLVVGFLLLCASIFTVFQAGFWALSKTGLVLRKRERRALTGVAIVIMLLAALQSIGQLTVRDATTLLLFTAVGYIYMTYPKPTESP